MSNPATGPSSKAKVGASQPIDNSLKRKRGMFQKDLQHMMYGFGDDANLEVLDSSFSWLILLQNLTSAAAALSATSGDNVTCGGHCYRVHKAQDVATKRGKLLTEDFLFLIRKDLPKLHRCTELLSMNEELKQARKAFEQQFCVAESSILLFMTSGSYSVLQNLKQELKDTEVRAYRTDPVQVRSCPVISFSSLCSALEQNGHKNPSVLDGKGAVSEPVVQPDEVACCAPAIQKSWNRNSKG
nr:transcription initiation factor TFIID subunit 13 [Ipomoea batatas]